MLFNKRLRKFFNRDLTDEMIWKEIINEGSLQNIHQLRTLNPEAARALIHLEKRMQLLSLGITELSAEVAAELARYPGEKIFLNCVTSISPEAAKAISQFKGVKLMFNGLKTVSLPVLGRLSLYKGALYLDGAEALEFSEEETRRAETVFSNLQFSKLSMTALKKTTPSMLKAMALFPNQLELNGIETLSEQDSEILAEHPGKILVLKGIKNLTIDMAKLFSRYKGFLYLNGAETVDEGLLGIISRCPEEFTFFTPAVKKRIEAYKKDVAQKEDLYREERLYHEQFQQEIKDKEALLLAEFEQFELIIKSSPVRDEPVEAEDPFIKPIDEEIIEDIELNLNYKISQKRNRIDELLVKGFYNLSEEETNEYNTLQVEIEQLNDEIRKTLDVLVERKELGSVVFNSSEDLVSYLKQMSMVLEESGTLDDIEKVDILGSSFVEDDGVLEPAYKISKKVYSDNNQTPIEGDGFQFTVVEG